MKVVPPRLSAPRTVRSILLARVLNLCATPRATWTATWRIYALITPVTMVVKGGVKGCLCGRALRADTVQGRHWGRAARAVQPWETLETRSEMTF